MKSAGAFAFGSVLARICRGEQECKSGNPPNVIIFLADDLGYGDLGCYGHPFIKTPHLDKFAAEGMLLSSCYSAAPICSPARAGLLTGRCSYRTGVYHLAGNKVHLRNQELTIAELLQKNGYATCFLGKWHLGRFDGEHPKPNEQGFDHWFATISNCYPKNPDQFVRNGRVAGKLQGWYCDLVVEEAIDWLGHLDSSKPFFIEICSSEPHTPVAPPSKYADMYKGAEIEEQAKRLEYGRVMRYPYIEDIAEQTRQYYGTVTQLDAAFGRLMDELNKRKLSENTIVIFTSDNGPEFPGGSTGLDQSRNRCWGTPGKLRGMKRHLYEGGIRVPALIRWPRGIKAPMVSDVPVSSVDFLPTLCDLIGTALPGDRVLDGVSIVPIFEGKGLNRTRPLCWNINFTGVPNMAMRAGDEVLLGFAEKPKVGQSLMEWIKSTKLSSFELYNLRTDLSQRIDLAGQQSEHLESLIKQMNQIWLELQREGPTWLKMGRIKPAVGKVW